MMLIRAGVVISSNMIGMNELVLTLVNYFFNESQCSQQLLISLISFRELKVDCLTIKCFWYPSFCCYSSCSIKRFIFCCTKTNVRYS